MSNTKLLSGNEAIARGAWEAGCDGGFGYPGTPSTETLEAFAKLPDVYAEWAVNEKVALENALGFSMAGHRALVTMKHVGVNVAADPLMSLAYSGVRGGLVLLAADDPGMFSSQNEQDSRYYAQFARVPMFEPADAAEARAMTMEAFGLSERLGTIAMVRSTVRISHTRTPVELGERTRAAAVPFQTSIPDWVMMPAYARPKRLAADERAAELVAYAEATPLTRAELRDPKVGFVCSGAAYQHVREACPDASVLKLGLSWPLPPRRLAAFFEAVEKVYVVEEASTYYADAVRALGLEPAAWPCGLPGAFELSPALIRAALGEELPKNDAALAAAATVELPARPPALCAGCPHRIPFVELKRMRAVVLGDIGCYTLGALAPLAVLESAIDMGASVSMGHGFEVARMVERERGDEVAGGNRPVFSVIGDSTFAHSGLSGVISAVYNAGTGNVVILDNRTTAMTGGQGNAVNGVTLQGRPTREVNLPALLRAAGVEDVAVVDALDAAAVREALRSAAANAEQLSVVICQAPCVVEYKVRHEPRAVNAGACAGCGACMRIGCPAVSKTDDGRAAIDPALCNGCGQCAQYCRFKAIEEA
jgi:indolepyruvate ferredoxin oxidoreductase alpha subunit